MGGTLAFVYRSPKGQVTQWVRWTNTLHQIFLDARLGSDPDAVMDPRLAQLNDDPPEPHSGLYECGSRLPAVQPEGYGIVVVDAMPLATGGRVKVTSCQGYCDPGDVTTSVPSNGQEDSEQAEFLDALFAKFKPIVSGWVPTKSVTNQQVVRSIPARTDGPKKFRHESESLVDLTEILGNPSDTKALMAIGKYRAQKVKLGRKTVMVDMFRFEVKDRDVDFVRVPEGKHQEVGNLLLADGFDIDLASPEWAEEES